MRGLPSILSLVPNEFNKFNNTGAHMLDSIYQSTSKLNKSRILGREKSGFSHLYATL